jgi:hypothetical protein
VCVGASGDHAALVRTLTYGLRPVSEPTEHGEGFTVNRLIRGAFGLACAMAACGEATGPGAVKGEYVLESIDADRLPATITYTPDASAEVRADTLWLDDDGTGRQSRRQRSVYGNASQEDQFEMLLTFPVNDGVIKISYVCPPNASCIEGPHAYAWKHSRGIILREAFDGRRDNVWVYRER